MHTFGRTYSNFHNTFERTFYPKILCDKCVCIEIILTCKRKSGIFFDDFRFRTGIYNGTTTI